MRLTFAALDLLEPVGDDEVVDRDGTRVRLLPPRPLPIDPVAWIDALLATDLPPGCVAEAPMVRATRTDLDWPAHVVVVPVVGAGGLVEERVAVLYRLLGWAAAAVLYAPAGAPIAIERLLAGLMTVRPDWRGETPASLSEIWEAKEANDVR